MTTTKILVTGSTGQSGSLIIREFIRRGVDVKALVRNPGKARLFSASPHVDIIAGDMNSPQTLAAALDGIERTILISSANDRMVETQCSFIEACRRAGVAHIIKFSGEESQIGFNAKHFRFTREHEEIEDYLEKSGLRWTHLRPSQFMQVYLREATTIKSKGIFQLPLAHITMSPVDLQDIAKIATALLIKGGHYSECLRITGPEALSMMEVASIIGRVTSRDVRYVNTSLENRRRILLASGLPLYLVDAIEEQSMERRNHPNAFIDLSTHRLFGIQPTYFEQFALLHASDFGR